MTTPGVRPSAVRVSLTPEPLAGRLAAHAHGITDVGPGVRVGAAPQPGHGQAFQGGHPLVEGHQVGQRPEVACGPATLSRQQPSLCRGELVVLGAPVPAALGAYRLLSGATLPVCLAQQCPYRVELHGGQPAQRGLCGFALVVEANPAQRGPEPAQRGHDVTAGTPRYRRYRSRTVAWASSSSSGPPGPSGRRSASSMTRPYTPAARRTPSRNPSQYAEPASYSVCACQRSVSVPGATMTATMLLSVARSRRIVHGGRLGEQDRGNAKAPLSVQRRRGVDLIPYVLLDIGDSQVSLRGGDGGGIAELCGASDPRAVMVWSVLDGHLLSRRAEATPTNEQALYVGYEAANTRLTCSLDRKPRDIQHRLAGGDHGGQLPAEFFAVAPEVAPAGRIAALNVECGARGGVVRQLSVAEDEAPPGRLPGRRLYGPPLADGAVPLPVVGDGEVVQEDGVVVVLAGAHDADAAGHGVRHAMHTRSTSIGSAERTVPVALLIDTSSNRAMISRRPVTGSAANRLRITSRRPCAPSRMSSSTLGVVASSARRDAALMSANRPASMCASDAGDVSPRRADSRHWFSRACNASTSARRAVTTGPRRSGANARARPKTRCATGSPISPGGRGAMNVYTIKPLGPDTWNAFAQLAGRHNGVWGGCWCTWFHGGVRREGAGRRGQPRPQGAVGQRGPGPRCAGYGERRKSRRLAPT